MAGVLSYIVVAFLYTLLWLAGIGFIVWMFKGFNNHDRK